MVIIPFQPFASFVEEITLDRVPYRLLFTWNTRGEYWNLIVRNRQDENLLSTKVVLGTPLLFQFPGRGLPSGDIVIVDLAPSRSQYNRIEYDDFTGERGLQVAYAEEAEL